MPPSFSDDDEVIDATPVARSGRSKIGDLVTAKATGKKDTTLAESEYKVIVELTGSEIGPHRSCGLDLVIVLDVSGSMDGIKMDKLKIAMKFLINKLSPIDRLSVITFSRSVKRLCPLLSMTKTARSNLERQVNELDAGGRTNITGGLQMGFKVLDDRRVKAGRSSAIMLLSDGIQTPGYGDLTNLVQVDYLPVHTFGLGVSHDPEMLKDIAEKSNNGTYSAVDVEGSNAASLSVAFSTCLAGLLTETVQDLELTISSDMNLKMVCAGTYPQSENDNGSITISFGNLYCSEKRRVLVVLQLCAADRPTTSADVLGIKYSFRFAVTR